MRLKCLKIGVRTYYKNIKRLDIIVSNLFYYYGADYGARTRHLDLGKVALYQMS